MRNSLHIRITGFVLLAYFALALVLGVIEYIEVRKSANQILDANLEMVSKIVDALVLQEIREINDFEYATKDFRTNLLNMRWKDSIVLRIYNKQGQVFFSTNPPPEDDDDDEEDTDEASGAGLEALPLLFSAGFADRDLRGDSWRSLVHANTEAEFFVEILQNYEFREDLEEEAIRGMFLQMFWVLIFAPLLVWLAVKRSLKQVRSASLQISSRSPNHLEPVSVESMPSEIRPMLDAINNLMARVRVALDNIRRFTADASHELRNPLASIRVNIQAALAEENPDMKEKSLDQALEGVEHATKLIENLLTMARFDSPEQLSLERVDLRQCAISCIEQQLPFASKKNIELELDAEAEPYYASASPEALQILLRNLVDNAVRYSPASSIVTVRLSRTPQGQSILEVIDSGPGIPADKREAVFERFVRLAERTTKGSGLGLSIVKKICSLMGVSLELAQGHEGKGCCFRAKFQPPPAGQ